ncbi:uncharacterized protein LOC131018376 [Salvia miltiorrhiza]|uniref:uncharacterized protein LOC131018376 n=1 Tax=Salvia miltiorrhiza TaxID=226208 RepID=UPI0025ABFAEA|nr:uncharacterized protein LOC131018376 [Salvia miltiorrhiza]
MNLLVWNVRGLTDESKRLLKEHCRSFSPLILGIIEPKSKFRKIQMSFWQSLNLTPRHQNCRLPRRSNIWFLAQPAVATTILFSSDQVVVSNCTWQNLCFRVAVIHGANDAVLRRNLWADLLNYIDGNTVFIGDFNAVKGAHERLSTVLPSRSSCADFCRFIDDTGFLEPSSSGLQFSWSGRRFLPNHVETLLDRALISSSFDNIWDFVNSHVLPRLTSDHSAIVLQCKSRFAPGKRPFRFQHLWMDHAGFLDLVRDSWDAVTYTPCPIFKVMIKLKRLKSVLREWNRTTFGNLDAKLAEAQEELASVQARISREGYTDDNFDEEVTKQAAINTMLTRKNVQLQQQSRVKWLQDGDRNTAFFHKALRNRKSGMVINHLNFEGDMVYEQSAIERHIVEHFTALFSQGAATSVDLVDLEANIDMQVNEAHNRCLIDIPSDEEIAATVRSMDASSAPGPDGFSGVFFHHCWDIIKEDIIRAVRCFFLNSFLPDGCNANTLVLIPKAEAVSSVSDLRPIILSNFFFKIISKVLAVRLNRVASDIVSQNQFGFISGRSIHDCIMLGSEGFNCMNRTNRSANMACKIDIKKAFDTMNWDFILKVFRVLGFHERFIQWISIIFSSARISILYNGHLSGYFACTRGVRQGDPLSPIIFGIAEDMLSHLILNCVAARRLTPMSFCRSMLFPTHLLYADDILIFCKASIRNAKTIKHILEYYGELSGQVCSLEKSRIYFAKGVSSSMKRGINQVLNFTQGNDHITYLGAPLFVGKPRASHLTSIKDKIIHKFSRWAGLHLSMAGRICLVNSVIQSSLTHTMMVYSWPKSLLFELDRKCRNFIWTGNTEQKPSCSVKWSRCCAIKEEGGLGIRSFTLMNKSFLMKLAWNMIKGNSFAHKTLSSRYLNPQGYAKENVANSSIWIGVKHEINVLVDDSYVMVGNGRYTLFWLDDWLGYRIRDKLGIPAFLWGLLQQPISDYFFDGKWHFSENFVDNFPEIVCDILLIHLGDGHDERFWKASLRGDVTSSLAFANISHRYPKVVWGKWIWDPAVPIRRSIVCWRLIHERLPTIDCMIRQGLIVPNACPICLTAAESINHTFWGCSRVIPIWQAFLGWFRQLHLLDCLDVQSFLVMAWNMNFSSLLGRLWKIGILSAIWMIWTSRNACIFDDQAFTAIKVLSFIKTAFKEAEALPLKLGFMANEWNDYLTLRSIGVSSRPAPPPEFLSVHWWPPDIGWIKVNTDGSASGSPGLIAGGGVFRDHAATVQGCFHTKGGSGFAFEAELLAAITAIAIAYNRGWHKLWLEADSSYVVSLLQQRSMEVPWRFISYWKETLARLHEITFRVSHIYREGNVVADIMANPARQEGFWSNGIEVIDDAVIRDIPSHSHLRRI